MGAYIGPARIGELRSRISSGAALYSLIEPRPSHTRCPIAERASPASSISPESKGLITIHGVREGEGGRRVGPRMRAEVSR